MPPELLSFLADLESLIAPMGHDYSKEAVHWKMNSAKIISRTKDVIYGLSRQLRDKSECIDSLREELERWRGGMFDKDSPEILTGPGLVQGPAYNIERMSEAESALLALARYVVSRS